MKDSSYLCAHPKLAAIVLRGLYSTFQVNVNDNYQIDHAQFVKLMQIYDHPWFAPSSVEVLGIEKTPHTLVFSSNRPLGVSIMREGGRNGYSAGKSMRK